jgi:tetratricopeptide (TPR) repeat protein
VAAGLIILMSAARPVFRWFKSTRATQLAAKAETFAAAGKLNDSADNFRAALQLDPVNYPALSGAARLATRAGRPEAIDLWEQVVKRPQATVEDRQGYAEQLLQVGKPRIAVPIIERLLKEAPNTRTLQLAGRYARSIGDNGKALQFARLAVKSAPNDRFARFQLAELLATSTDAAERAEARGILWELIEKQDAYRQPAIEALAGAPELSDADRQRVLELLRPLAPNNIRDDLLAGNLRLQVPGADSQRIYDEVTARWNRGSVSELVDLARWLNLHQQSDRVLALFSLDRALENNQLLLVRLDALATLQRWNEISTILTRPNLTLDPSVLECFLARTAQEQNAALDAELHWNHAISLASGDAFKLRFVADFARQSKAHAVALKTYEQLAKIPEHTAFAYRGIEQLSGQGNDLAVQRAAAEKMKSLARNDPNAVAQLSYVNLLAGTEVESNTATARELVRQHPDRLSFRVTAALGLLRQHDPGMALEQFKGPAGAPPIDWSKTPAAWRAVYAATLMANEQADAARDVIAKIPVDQLSPEERALIEVR